MQPLLGPELPRRMIQRRPLEKWNLRAGSSMRFE
jgi:hypothetical protein